MLAMSYWFYAAWNFHLLALIIFTTAVSYFCALAMEKTDKKSLRRLYITLTLIVCLGTLFFFKYYNFMAGTVSGIMSAINGKSYDFSLNLILPVGISFYTFQTLSYAIDVYRGDIKRSVISSGMRFSSAFSRSLWQVLSSGRKTSCLS